MKKYFLWYKNRVIKQHLTHWLAPKRYQQYNGSLKIRSVWQPFFLKSFGENKTLSFSYLVILRLASTTNRVSALWRRVPDRACRIGLWRSRLRMRRERRRWSRVPENLFRSLCTRVCWDIRCSWSRRCFADILLFWFCCSRSLGPLKFSFQQNLWCGHSVARSLLWGFSESDSTHRQHKNQLCFEPSAEP